MSCSFVWILIPNLIGIGLKIWSKRTDRHIPLPCVRFVQFVEWTHKNERLVFGYANTFKSRFCLALLFKMRGQLWIMGCNGSWQHYRENMAASNLSRLVGTKAVFAFATCLSLNMTVNSGVNNFPYTLFQHLSYTLASMVQDVQLIADPG